MLIGVSFVAAEPLPGPWQPVPWVSAEHREAGVRIGGEGAQWPGDIAIDETDGSLMIFATDVGGLYRSTDQGQTWEPANVGFTPRGARDVAIDPHNPKRAIAVASNSMARDIHGLYLSEDAAASWEIVEPANMCGMRDRRESVVFDPSTYDQEADLTRRVYWSRTKDGNNQYGTPPESKPGLYRSDDGGRKWERLGSDSDVAGHSHLAVHPTSGRLYASNENGLFLSDDGGESFREFADGEFTSVETTKHEPDRVWATRPNAIETSTDAGETWSKMETSGLDEPLTFTNGKTASGKRKNVKFDGLTASPAAPGRLAMRSLADDWQWHKHVSHDGGKTWKTATTSKELAFLPQNARQYQFVWHPTDENKIWSYGGDWVTHSTDGGESFKWASEGQNAVLVGGGLAFNPHHPELIFVGSQDYNGAVTHDGGHTWTYTNASGKSWGGFTYGGIAINPDVYVVGLAPSWTGDRQLRMTRDGGKTWNDVNGVTWAKNRGDEGFGASQGLIDPRDANVAYVARYRTTDAGETWEPMKGVTDVFTADAEGRIYGTNHIASDRAVLVRSDDYGKTWLELAEVEGPVLGLDVTPDGSTIYVANIKALLAVDVNSKAGARDIEVPASSTNRRRVTGIAVDPKNPQTLYVTQHLNIEATDVALIRSTNGGESWEVLTRNEPLDGTVRDGGREAMYVEIDPHTGHVWTPTSCYGIWKYVPERETEGQR